MPLSTTRRLIQAKIPSFLLTAGSKLPADEQKSDDVPKKPLETPSFKSPQNKTEQKTPSNLPRKKLWTRGSSWLTKPSSGLKIIRAPSKLSSAPTAAFASVASAGEEKLTIEFDLEKFTERCKNLLKNAPAVQKHLLEEVLPKLKKDIEQVNLLLDNIEYQQEPIKTLLRTIHNNYCDTGAFSGLQQLHNRLGLSIAGGILKPIAWQCQKLVQVLDKPLLEKERQKKAWLDKQFQAAERVLSEEVGTLTVKKDTALPESINEIACQMGKYLRDVDCSVPQGCYFVYGWSLEEHAARESWVQDCLRLLKSHLEHAGITTVHLDVESNPLGGAVKTYMEQTQTDEYVLMIGTQSALDKQKYTNGTAAICTEIILGKRKRAEDIKHGLQRVFPILLTHDMERSFPPEYEGFNTIRDWRIAGYLENLKELIFALYGLDKQKFYKSYLKKWEELETQSPHYEIIQRFKQDFQTKRSTVKESKSPGTAISEEKTLAQQWPGLNKIISQRQPLVTGGINFNSEMGELEEDGYRQALLDQQTQSVPAISRTEELKNVRDNGYSGVPTLVSYDIPKPIEGFVGRSDLFDNLAAQLGTLDASGKKEVKEPLKNNSPLATSPRKVALYGLGGVGKTQVALQYAHLAGKTYEHKFQFVADNPDTLISSYRLFAKEKKLIEERYVSDKNVINAVTRWLLDHPNWLILFDNVERYEDIAPYLPTEGTGDILLTSRLAPVKWPKSIIPIHVKVLTPAEAEQLIASLINTPKDPDIPKLAELLEYLPLALVQASAYIRHHTTPIAVYLQAYQQRAHYLLKQAEVPAGFPSHKPVFLTWDINLDAISKEEKAKGKTAQAKQLLQFCAYLSPQQIPSRLIEMWYQYTYPATYPASQELYREVRGRLHAYSLIQLDENDESIQIHRLVQQVMRDRLTLAEQHTQIGHVLACFSAANPQNGKQTDRQLWRALIPHLECIIDHHDKSKRAKDEYYVLALAHLGYIYFGQLRYGQKALPYLLLAAEHSYPPAYLMLYYLYAGNRGIAKNPTFQAQWGEELKKNIAWFIERAEKGEAYAQCGLGYCYFGGIGIEKEWSQAVVWWQRAAEQGDALAQNALGICYQKGEGVPKNVKKAFYWKQQAAEQGLAIAQFNLGICHAQGAGVTKDQAKAVVWYRKAADQGHAAAQFRLGVHYANGTGVGKDETQAVVWYRKAADQGYAAGQCNLGWCYDNGAGVVKDEAQAVVWYRKAADQGHAAAQFNLGWCYANGAGIAKDETQGVEWYQKAAEQGDAAAQFNLGIRYARGNGVAKDETQAVVWYRKAAQKGHAAAQGNLGACYENGRGVIRNQDQAVEWYQKAADQGYVAAQLNLGVCYAQGAGVAKDEIQAVQWYQKAADQGHAYAQFLLGIRYAAGKGIAKDEIQAVKWYQKAADQGDTDAKANLEELLKENPALALSFTNSPHVFFPSPASSKKEKSASVVSPTVLPLEKR